MNGFGQLLGIFRKEWILHSRFRWTFVNNIFVSPLVSALPMVLIYKGLFRVEHGLHLGEVSASSYSPYLIFGFLVHACLNSGYYFLPSRVMDEWWNQTLAVHYFAPCNRFVLLVGWIGLDALRCGLIFLLVFWGLSFVHPTSWGVVAAEGGITAFLFLLGLFLGVLRCYALLVTEGRAEMANNFYMAFVFLSCLYIPRSFLPELLRPICALSPAFYGGEIMRELWEGRPVMGIQLMGLVCGTAVVASATWVFWLSLRRMLKEKCFR